MSFSLYRRRGFLLDHPATVDGTAVHGMLSVIVLTPPPFPFLARLSPSLQQILFRKRFMDFQTDEEILRLIDDSVRSWTTGQYDDFQQKTNGYLK